MAVLTTRPSGINIRAYAWIGGLMFLVVCHYIHETVHRNKFLFNNQPDALIIHIYSVIKLTCFGHLLCPS
jgi:hypothetical protein